MLTLKNWVIRRNFICGDVYGHPSFPDGTRIATSSIDRKYKIKDDLLVHTMSGKVYQLDPDSEHVKKLLAIWGR